MNKPLILQVKETEENIIKELENSKLSAYILKQILSGLYEELNSIEQKEINDYNESIKENKKKVSDKNAKDTISRPAK